MRTIQENGTCIPDDDGDYDDDDVDDDDDDDDDYDDDEESLLERSIGDFDRRSVCIHNNYSLNYMHKISLYV